jgi:hypothetical protein
MMVDACAKCQDLYDRDAGAVSGLCPRCGAIAELLSAADALNARVRSELERSSNRLLIAVVQRASLMPLVERTAQAIERARAL